MAGNMDTQQFSARYAISVGAVVTLEQALSRHREVISPQNGAASLSYHTEPADVTKPVRAG
jgi:hypothetical protein